MVKNTATHWEISLSNVGRPDAEHERVAAEIASLAPFLRHRFSADVPSFTTEHGYLLDGELEETDAVRIAGELLADPVLQTSNVTSLGRTTLTDQTITVLKKPGVMDPPAESTEQAIRQMGLAVDQVRTFRRFTFAGNASDAMLKVIANKVLANEAIEQVVFGSLSGDHLTTAPPYEFVRVTVPLRGMDDEQLEQLSRDGQLYLEVEEMRAIRDHFEQLGRNPTDVELETLAQTWSEHCCHKTLLGPYRFNGENGVSGLLKDTIVKATRTVNRDWCVSVFTDNAGIVKFDDDFNVCFKVETHNHPSAIEPYGGANTGIGGCIRDPLGTGLGAKPICNTDVFCVAPPTVSHEELPEGVLHPERILRGVVAGVRDYGNRMGIPTVNGAVYFDDRYLGNPLVYCGVVGLIPADMSFGSPEPGDLIVAIGGRTGRDGIHGATFSSGELTTESETVSGGAVQIGNPIMEKKLVDVLLQARDQGLYRAVTDCGAGGFSSAVGEMGEKIGAFVRLDAAPLKYEGLSYDEIWISEAQERMVLAVPPDRWEELRRLASGEDLEAVVLGHFEPTGKLKLTYRDEVVGELSMQFLHNGRPRIMREGHASEFVPQPHQVTDKASDLNRVLLEVLASPNVCSKEWIVRQYDHEVQAGSVVKPLVGTADDGPSDAAVIAPVLGSTRGIAVGCGMNPRYGDLDPYWMAASGIDEAIRNVIAVGGDPDRVAILDNFCWGNASRPEVFGSLCQAAFACRDVAIGYNVPFISGKDSLNNEFNTGSERIVIPPTLLISSLTIVPDVRNAVTMDFKAAGNRIVLVGVTRDELGGSHFNIATGSTGGRPPRVDTEAGKPLFAAVHQAISQGLVRSCHDLSEGGLALALAEMAFAGDLGAHISLNDVPSDGNLADHILLFSESNTRFLMEVSDANLPAFERVFTGVPFAVVGSVVNDRSLSVTNRDGSEVISLPVSRLKEAWRGTLAWA